MSVGPEPAAQGLSTAEAAERLSRVGHNVLPEPEHVPAWRRLLEQVLHFFALLLWVAAALALVGGMPALAAAIAAVVVVNGLFAFVQEHRAERAAAQLRDLLPVSAVVLRDGREQHVTADLIVPGDLLLLAAGDRVTADARCLDAQGAVVDTSMLTGESVPQPVETGEEVAAGCFLVQGRATTLVLRTGERTRLAQIAHLTQQRRPRTPLERDIEALVRRIGIIAAAVGIGFFVLMLALGVPATDGFIFGVGVTVALVPEGLLPTVTLSLAIGAQRMAGERALVRRLESVETLGATTFICTDKTGTLTENRMNVVAVWTPGGSAEIAGIGYAPDATVTYSSATAREPVTRAAQAASLASARVEQVDGRPAGDPMEVAIWTLVARLGSRASRHTTPHGTALPTADPGAPPVGTPEDFGAGEFLPFDTHRRLSAAVLPDRVVVKGAPEVVLAAADAGESARGALDAMLTRGLRVLAVAQCARPDPAGNGSPAADDTSRSISPGGNGSPAGNGSRTGTSAGGPPDLGALLSEPLDLLGLIGYHDPPRDGVPEAIAECRRAGIRLAMITGDHPATAGSIARQIGLALPESPVLVASELPDDPQVLGAVVDRDGVVLARATPEDKLRITQALQARGHVVAMTGDGVNDAPALTLADIGVAMGASGTQVAREAADLVLLDDHFATIVAAVRQGRETFLNVRRFLTYHLTDNVAELAPFVLWALSGGRFPLALGVMQILALDLGTDTLPATALGAERSAGRVLDRPPVRGHLLDRSVAWRAFGVLGPAEALTSLAVFTLGLVLAGWRPGGAGPDAGAVASASGGAFLTVVVMQMANALACRSSSRPVWRMDLLGNRFLLIAIATSAAFALVCLAVPAIGRLLGQGWPPVATLPLIAAAPLILVVVDGAWKRVAHRPRRAGTSRSPGVG